MIFAIYKNNLTKITTRVSVAVMVFVLLVPVSTSAYFSGEATAETAKFTAGTVDFTAPTSLSTSIDSTNPDTTNFNISDTGSIETNYLITASPDTCNASFYNGLEARLENPAVLFDGMLGSLSATSTTDGSFDLILQASSTLIASQNETCTVEFTISAWQGIFSTNTYGFSDTKTINLTVTATEDIGTIPPILPLPTANVVLNEIYPSKLATTTQPLEREWVELYNGTAGAIDVAGWTISEFVGGNTSNEERYHKIINDCTGYLASTHARPFNTNNTIILAGGYLVIEFCGTAEYLSNGGDTVMLYDATGTSTPAVDSHTFGNTTNGKSHARIPDGGAWVDPIPTPGVHNVATREDLEAEGWTKEQIIEVLGEEVYLEVTDVAVEEKISPVINFNFATTTEVTVPSTATSTIATSTATTTVSATTTLSNNQDSQAIQTSTLVNSEIPAFTFFASSTSTVQESSSSTALIDGDEAKDKETTTSSDDKLPKEITSEQLEANDLEDLESDIGSQEKDQAQEESLDNIKPVEPEISSPKEDIIEIINDSI